MNLIEIFSFLMAVANSHECSHSLNVQFKKLKIQCEQQNLFIVNRNESAIKLIISIERKFSKNNFLQKFSRQNTIPVAIRHHLSVHIGEFPLDDPLLYTPDKPVDCK